MNPPRAKEQPVVLIVDADRAIRRLLRAILIPDGYKVCDMADGKSGLTAATKKRPNVIILELALPDMGAIEFLGKLRDWSRTPVMILSESDAEAAKVAALDAGADDFLLKPFGESEIRARLRALLRRFPGLPNERFFVQGELMVDLTSRQVTVRGEIVDLTATERSLLLELVRHAGKVVPHEQLLVSVWGPNSLGQPQVLREYINHLRKKLNPAGGGPAIETTYGAGYRLAVKGVGDDY